MCPVFIDHGVSFSCFLCLCLYAQEHIGLVRSYLAAQGMLRDYNDATDEGRIHYSQCVELDLATVVPCLAGN